MDLIAWYSVTRRCAGCSARPLHPTCTLGIWSFLWCVDPIRCRARHALPVLRTSAGTVCTPNLGIIGLDGMVATRFTVDPAYVVPVPDRLGELAVLVEPASVVAKAWERIDRIRTGTSPVFGSVLVIGAGPIGLLATLLGRARGHETHVVDLIAGGPKQAAAEAVGAHYLVAGEHVPLPSADIVIECTGVGSVVLEAIARSASSATVCLTGLSTGARTIDFDAAAFNRTMVLENDVVFGSVNAHHRHYVAAVDALSAADPEWVASLISRRVPLTTWHEAFARHPDDIKVCLDLGSEIEQGVSTSRRT